MKLPFICFGVQFWASPNRYLLDLSSHFYTSCLAICYGCSEAKKHAHIPESFYGLDPRLRSRVSWILRDARLFDASDSPAMRVEHLHQCTFTTCHGVPVFHATDSYAKHRKKHEKTYEHQNFAIEHRSCCRWNQDVWRRRQAAGPCQPNQVERKLQGCEAVGRSASADIGPQTRGSGSPGSPPDGLPRRWHRHVLRMAECMKFYNFNATWEQNWNFHEFSRQGQVQVQVSWNLIV